MTLGDELKVMPQKAARYIDSADLVLKDMGGCAPPNRPCTIDRVNLKGILLQ
jgi:hypothetical protein